MALYKGWRGCALDHAYRNRSEKEESMPDQEFDDHAGFPGDGSEDEYPDDREVWLICYYCGREYLEDELCECYELGD